VNNEFAIELIRDVTKVILEEAEPNLLASTLALKTLAHLDCRGVIIGVVRHEGFLDLIGTYGYPNDATEPFMRMPLWTPLPITDAARQGKASDFFTPHDLVTKYPQFALSVPQGDAVTVSIPISFHSSVIGAVGFTSLHPPTDDFLTSPTTETIHSLLGIYLRNFLTKTKRIKDEDLELEDLVLTPRQKQIIRFFSENLTTEQIATRLNFSTSTIKQDIIKIYELLGVNTRDQVLEIMKKVDLAG